VGRAPRGVQGRGKESPLKSQVTFKEEPPPWRGGQRKKKILSSKALISGCVQKYPNGEGKKGTASRKKRIVIEDKESRQYLFKLEVRKSQTEIQRRERKGVMGNILQAARKKKVLVDRLRGGGKRRESVAAVGIAKGNRTKYQERERSTSSREERLRGKDLSRSEPMGFLRRGDCSLPRNFNGREVKTKSREPL